jgi:hypothetical protein
MPEVIRKGRDVFRDQTMLSPFGRGVQSIKGKLPLVGKVALPQAMPAQYMSSQVLSPLGQRQQVGPAADQVRGFELPHKPQHRAHRASQTTGKFRRRKRSALLPGTVDLLEGIFPQDLPPPPPPTPAEREPSQQSEAKRQANAYGKGQRHRAADHVSQLETRQAYGIR